MPTKRSALKRPAEAPLQRQAAENPFTTTTAAAATAKPESTSTAGNLAASATTLTAAAAVVEPDQPKVIMSKAQRRKLKKPPVIVTAEMKERAREETRELRKHLRMLKSNGARRKVAKLHEKRERETNDDEEAINAFDSDFRPRKKGRRLE